MLMFWMSWTSIWALMLECDSEVELDPISPQQVHTHLSGTKVHQSRRTYRLVNHQSFLWALFGSTFSTSALHSKQQALISCNKVGDLSNVQSLMYITCSQLFFNQICHRGRSRLFSIIWSLSITTSHSYTDGSLQWLPWYLPTDEITQLWTMWIFMAGSWG